MPAAPPTRTGTTLNGSTGTTGASGRNNNNNVNMEVMAAMTRRSTLQPVVGVRFGAPRQSGSKNRRNAVLGFVVLVVILGSAWRTLRGSEGKNAEDAVSSGVISSEEAFLTQEAAPVEHVAKSTDFQELAKKTPLTLPLQPPFRIVELGHVRTGSTFQTHLLDAIAQLKTANHTYDVSFEYLGGAKKPSDYYKGFGKSFVVKSHNFRDHKLQKLQKEGKLVVFTSGMRAGEDDDILRYTLYDQMPQNLQKCSLCEVDRYRRIFGLTDSDISTIKEYLRAFEKVRRCCGLQMSKYEVARLNGCDMTELSQRPGYPRCESIDKQQAEQDLMKSPIPHRSQRDKFNWQKPGDCAKFDKIVKSGHGMNNRDFDVNKDCPK